MQSSTKKDSRPRGRPRAYDPQEALARARDTFWRNGYAGTSLDDLSKATGMNRPSLYGAFGDKHALYLQTMERYVEAGRAAMESALDNALPLREALMRVFDGALGWYLPAHDAARGCLLIGTAAVEAVNDEAVRERLAAGLRTFDKAFERRLRAALAQGELPPDASAPMLARLASALLHSMALRARAGDSRSSLRAMAAAGVALICGEAPAAADVRPARRRAK
ncbi:TetR/AcrR family transcriptional regulator [Paraburkholderia silvatlantica]|uniref:AcrR family transcriptional regulator n=1 Tax=Paraburkholderia silvatlantica TaxID=321895 RepID=A0ABR6FQI4_9BURK|nr:TetR/AcrR family transcriptional regulator [Paraburkholderia silvatlantica]MBB2928874.1 AcrR family transcriptional regulator [Paraburkholderia silvatlantica]PVY35456.1 TetR family transcriptional regulator [Paraburkholderia silvatlantica]PXW41098.1 TetR family transcriptional regulator [Paraburkholderia silvatlantica]TDQ98075.1 TetR family transcriptional regulator [Paraburkholderia silvatlantica]